MKTMPKACIYAVRSRSPKPLAIVFTTWMSPRTKIASWSTWTTGESPAFVCSRRFKQIRSYEPDDGRPIGSRPLRRTTGQMAASLMQATTSSDGSRVPRFPKRSTCPTVTGGNRYRPTRDRNAAGSRCGRIRSRSSIHGASPIGHMARPHWRRPATHASTCSSVLVAPRVRLMGRAPLVAQDIWWTKCFLRIGGRGLGRRSVVEGELSGRVGGEKPADVLALVTLAPVERTQRRQLASSDVKSALSLPRANSPFPISAAAFRLSAWVGVTTIVTSLRFAWGEAAPMASR